MPDKVKSPERLVFFSDAVVAIALTLLILPLTDIVRDIQPGTSSFELIKQHQALIWSFLLSFIVIARYWLVHHRLFQEVKAYNHPLILVNLLWILTIAILPFPTEMVANFGSHDRFTLVVYIGTLFVSSLLLTIMLVIIRDDPNVLRESGAISYHWQFDSLSTTAVMGVALLTVAIFPQVSYYVMLLNVVQPWFVRVWFRYRVRPTTKAGA